MYEFVERWGLVILMIWVMLIVTALIGAFIYSIVSLSPCMPCG